jgi:hypothetical protein
MAKIWFAKAGQEPTYGDAPYALSLSDCIRCLSLKKSDYLCDLKTTPDLGQSSAIDGFTGPRHVVVEVPGPEALAMGWKAGFYGPVISVGEAQQLLDH